MKTIAIDDRLHERLKKEANKRGQKLYALVSELIDEGLRKEKDND